MHFNCIPTLPAFFPLFFDLQTQPVPNPVAYYLHQAPEQWHWVETAGNHFVELVAPFLLVIPWRPMRLVGGVIQVLFQVISELINELIKESRLLFYNNPVLDYSILQLEYFFLSLSVVLLEICFYHTQLVLWL